jgi:hypothetical protein
MRGTCAALLCALAFAVPALSGCGNGIYIGPDGPDPAVVPLRCRPPRGEVSDLLVLLAQSVPTAQAVPCLRQIPLDWTVREAKVKRGNARITLGYVPQMDQAFTIELTRKCDPGDAAESASDQPGMRRFDRPLREGTHYSEERYYVGSGSCTTFRFDLRGAGAAALAAEIWANLSFVDRPSLDRQIRDHTDDKLRLDPPPVPVGLPA